MRASMVDIPETETIELKNWRRKTRTVLKMTCVAQKITKSLELLDHKKGDLHANSPLAPSFRLKQEKGRNHLDTLPLQGWN